MSLRAAQDRPLGRTGAEAPRPSPAACPRQPQSGGRRQLPPALAPLDPVRSTSATTRSHQSANPTQPSCHSPHATDTEGVTQNSAYMNDMLALAGYFRQAQFDAVRAARAKTARRSLAAPTFGPWAARQHPLASGGESRRRPSRGGARRPYRWSDATIERELRALLAERDIFPTLAELDSIGRTDLRSAITDHGGIAYWARRLGMPLPDSRDRPAYTELNAIVDARVVISELGYLPSEPRLRRLGHPLLATHVRAAGGATASETASPQ